MERSVERTLTLTFSPIVNRGLQRVAGKYGWTVADAVERMIRLNLNDTSLPPHEAEELRVALAQETRRG